MLSIIAVYGLIYCPKPTGNVKHDLRKALANNYAPHKELRQNLNCVYKNYPVPGWKKGYLALATYQRQGQLAYNHIISLQGREGMNEVKDILIGLAVNKKPEWFLRIASDGPGAALEALREMKNIDELNKDLYNYLLVEYCKINPKAKSELIPSDYTRRHQ